MKALVLAGGRGTRLRPYTMVIPKPLMPVGDYPILEILLRQLKRSGVSEIYMAVGHMHHLIRAFFEDGERMGLKIRYVLEDEPLGTAGPIATCLDQLGESFFVLNGDLLTTLDFSAMRAHHQAEEASATIALYTRTVKIDFGVVEMDERTVLTGYREKPTYTFEVSMGVNLLNAESVRPHLKPGTYLDMPDLLLNLSKAGSKVVGFRSDCFWLDIGRVDDYEQATRVFEERKADFLVDPA